MVEIWDQLGRVDKIFEVTEDYLKHHVSKKPVSEEYYALIEIYDYLQKVSNISEKSFEAKAEGLKNIIARMQVSANVAG